MSTQNTARDIVLHVSFLDGAFSDAVLSLSIHSPESEHVTPVRRILSLSFRSRFTIYIRLHSSEMCRERTYVRDAIQWELKC